jgi:hypothetical protein
MRSHLALPNRRHRCCSNSIVPSQSFAIANEPRLFQGNGVIRPAFQIISATVSPRWSALRQPAAASRRVRHYWRATGMRIIRAVRPDTLIPSPQPSTKPGQAPDSGPQRRPGRLPALPFTTPFVVRELGVTFNRELLVGTCRSPVNWAASVPTAGDRWNSIQFDLRIPPRSWCTAMVLHRPSEEQSIMRTVIIATSTAAVLFSSPAFTQQHTAADQRYSVDPGFLRSMGPSLRPPRTFGVGTRALSEQGAP